MTDKIKKFVTEYQCSGCGNGDFPDCYTSDDRSKSISCTSHVPGTMIAGIGKIFISLPVGFCQLGIYDDMKIHIFEEYKEYDKFNVPVWKYLDSNGNTIVRGLSPRINQPFLHIFKGDHISDIMCIEITDADIEFMD